MFSIGIIIISKEIVSLLNIGVLEIKINEKSEPQQGTLYQGPIEVVPSTTKTIWFNVRLEISMENKVYTKAYYHHSQVNIEMDETLAKIQIQNHQITCWTLIEEQ